MIRKLVQLAMFLLIANALYRIAPVSIHYYKFKDALQELARGGHPRLPLWSRPAGALIGTGLPGPSG